MIFYWQLIDQLHFFTYSYFWPVKIPKIGIVKTSSSAQSIASLSRISARSLEDVVKDCLRPLLKDWLDRNLPTLCERLVQREIRRITGQID